MSERDGRGALESHAVSLRGFRQESCGGRFARAPATWVRIAPEPNSTGPLPRRVAMEPAGLAQVGRRIRVTASRGLRLDERSVVFKYPDIS